MKKITISIAALAMLASASYAQNLDRSVRPKPGPAPVIQLKDAQSFTLPNGLKVFVVENHKLPVVSYSFQFDIDPVIDPAKAGLDDFIGSLVTAGTKKMSKQQFDEATDRIGAVISASGSSMYGNAMKKHQHALLSLMADAMMNADFKQDELDKLKKQFKTGIEQAKIDPDAMLGNVSRVLNYGKNHPYALVTTEETIDNITLEDCINYYKTYYRPNVAYLAVVGDITLAEAKALVTKYFGSWKKSSVPKVNYPAVSFPEKTTVDFVPRDNAVQSVIGVTYPIDLKPGTQDVIKVRMLNEILGGSGTGRLFLNLREQHGWTYGAYSSFDNDIVVGNFQAYAKARNAVTDSSVNEILAEMRRIRDEKVDATTLQEMKNYVSGTFAIGLESPQTIARYAINIERYKMPKDYYKNYLKSVNAITVDDIQATAKKYVKPDAARIIVVGDKEEAVKLKRFAADGKINYYDHYGNPIEAPVSKAVESGVTAQSVMSNYIKAVGGEQVVNGLKSIAITLASSMQGTEIKMVRKVVSPDKFMMSIIVPQMGEVQRIVVNGNKGFASAMGQTQDLDEATLATLKDQANLQSEFYPEKFGYTLNLKGIETVEGKECYVIEKTKGEFKATVYIDKATNLPVKEVVVDGKGQSQTSLYDDYRAVNGANGYKVAHKIVSQTPMGNMEMTVEKVEVNTTIKDSEFK